MKITKLNTRTVTVDVTTLTKQIVKVDFKRGSLCQLPVITFDNTRNVEWKHSVVRVDNNFVCFDFEEETLHKVSVSNLPISLVNKDRLTKVSETTYAKRL